MCGGSCRKSGTIGVPGRVHPGRGTKGLKSGTSRDRIIRDWWQPYFTAHRPALSTKCSEYRTMQLGLCSRRRGDHTPSHYCTMGVLVDGCQSSSGSHTSWQFDVQSSEHVHSGLPTPPNRRTCLQPNFAFICHPAAGPTVHKNRLL